MTQQRYADILIVTALLEEQFLLSVEYPDALQAAFNTKARVDPQDITVPGLIGKQVLITFHDGKELTIAWATLGSGKRSEGNSMGNIFAYDACVRLAEHFCPRIILLLGVSGGSAPPFQRGDVGFGILTGYSTYCRFEAGTSISETVAASKLTPKQKQAILARLVNLEIDPNDPPLRYVPRDLPLVASSDDFCAAARIIRDKQEWQPLAKTWFSPKNVTQFLTKGFDLDCDNTQLPFERETPFAAAGVLASGDAVIASTKLQEHIHRHLTFADKHTKASYRAEMFDMESFGVGLFCSVQNQTHKMDYGVVKGICDLAGETKDDKSRLCALSSASAFLFTMLTEPGFYGKYLVSDEERRWSGQTACIWPCLNVPYKRCVDLLAASEVNILTTERPCTDPALADVSSDTELPGARLFQHTESIAYSECVKHFIQSKLSSDLNNTTNRLLLLFPYSVHDLLAFYRNTENLNDMEQKWIADLEQAVPGATVGSLDDVLSNARLLGQKAYRDHPHFNAANTRCAEWIASGQPFERIAQHMARVVCIREEGQSRLATDPRFLMHPFMCGLCIPTFIASRSVINQYGADEATYFHYTHCEGNHSQVVVCLKYSDRSKLLALLGRCDAIPRPHAKSKAFDMFNEIREWIGSHNQITRLEPTERYAIFPSLRLLNKYGVAWQNDATLLPKLRNLTQAQQDNCAAYFNRLADMERTL